MSADIQIEDYIAAVPDFPKPGILFRDITPLLASPAAFNACLEQLATKVRSLNPTHLIGVESRGFIFGAPLAARLDIPLLLARKPGKLPRSVHTVTYELEYGVDQLCLHRDDLPQGARALVIDDLLATGGTAAACFELIRRSNAEVIGALFLIELTGLGGRYRLNQGDATQIKIESLLSY